VTPTVAVSSGLTVSTSAFPGQTPSGHAVDLATFLKAEAKSLAAPVRSPVLPSSLTAPTVPSPPWAGPAARHASIPSAPRPDGGGLNYGYLIGTIVAARPPHVPLSGAVVSANPLVTFCPSIGCISNQTGSDGQFKVAAGLGENEILVQDSYFMTNRTWAYVTAGAIINVGTIEMVADGYVTGVLRGGDPSHEPVPAMNVTATTRDGAFTASPSAHSNSAGAFTVAVPPVPSEITFVPIFAGSPYEPNETFVNVSAGQTINIGTVYMQHPTLVSVNIVDSLNGAPITAAFETLAALTVCSKVTGYCEEQGNPVSGPTLTAFAPVGPDTMQVYTLGFVANFTSLGWVPAEPLGTAPIPEGTVDMVPDGAVSFTVNVTGISQPYGETPPSSIWQIPNNFEGTVYVTDCSSDGVETASVTPSGNLTSTACASTCVNPGILGAILALPLRNYLTVTPSTSTQCDPFEITWPIPGDMPVFPNFAWANVTPDQFTNAGSINLLPGTYIQGQVLPSSSVGWNVEACSTDESNICGAGVYADQAYDDDFNNFPPEDCPLAGEPNADTTFCVPAPPGPVLITVTSPNGSANFTWANDTPLSWHLLPLPLSVGSLNHVQSINLTAARLSGRVLQARSLTPISGLPAVEACPAGTPSAAVSCGTGVPNSTGFFSLWAPIGWDHVLVSAPDYVSNGTWVYVEKSNSTGTILVTPFSFLQGRVVDPSGNGIYEASLQLCPVSNPTGCSPIGSDGLASTGGFYYGATPAGSLPLGSYRVVATAPGYTTDWTWVNLTTPGQNFTVPTIVLDPLGGSAPSLPAGGGGARAETDAGPSSGSPLIGAWIAGTVVDADRNIGLTTASVTANPVNGGPPDVLSSIRPTGGEFNDSLPIGDYDVQIAQTGFNPAYLFLNVSGNSTYINLGTIALQPFPTVTGRLLIDPASWRDGVTIQMGLGPGGATVQVCTTEATVCGPGGTVDSAGDFNASAPVGFYDFLAAAGTGTGPGTFTGGFDANHTFVNVTNASEGPPSNPVTIGLAIYGIVTGQVMDATSHGAQPVRYDGIVVDSDFPIDATQPEELTADGQFAVIFPESEQLNLTVGGVGAWVPINETIPSAINMTGGYAHLYLQPGGLVSFGPRFSLEHYGWIDLRVTNNATGLPLPYAAVSAQENGFLWGAPVEFSTSGVANAGGYANLTAPPSSPSTQKLSVNVTAPDYLYKVVNLTVNASRTTLVNGSTPFNMKPVKLGPWAWITGIVSDAVSGRPIQGVAVSVTDSGLQSGAIGVTTNGLGKFLTDAPVSPSDALSLAIDGYSSNLTRYNVTSGAWIVAPPVHLTGDGIVEGRVISSPGGIPVPGATVAVCKSSQSNCPDSVTTNASGVFVIAAAAAVDAITVSAPGFVGNVPTILTVASDTWVWAGATTLYQYADVSGTVLGLPNDLPLAGANASLCGVPITGGGAGPCFVTVQTGVDGNFAVQAPAGTYVLDVNTTFYNDSYLTVSLLAGEDLSVGSVFVQEYGTMTGTVESVTTDTVVAGATVSACEDWGVGTCLVPTTTGPDGRFVLSGPSGPYTVEVGAAGYQASFASTVLASAATVTVPTFLLEPIGPGSSYTVSGTVFTQGASPVALGGAVVTASGGFATVVTLAGDFSFTLPWGTYTMSATLPGYLESRQTVVVQGTLTNVDFTLTAMTYAVTGVVTDGLSGHTLAGVQLTEDGSPVGAATPAAGTFELTLTNGTHELVALPPDDSSAWVAVPFVVSVDGAALVHNLVLYPPAVTVNGVVVSSLSGTPIGGAKVTISGMTLENIAWSTTVTTSSDGRFTAIAYPGTYEVQASDAGFSSGSMALQVTDTATVPVTVGLSPISTVASGVSSNAMLWAAVGIGGAAAVTVGLVLLVRRPSVASRKVK
jgi:hypothetical protein